jgi:hypothetical protein
LSTRDCRQTIAGFADYIDVRLCVENQFQSFSYGLVVLDD